MFILRSEEDRLCGELRSAQGTLEQLKRERGNLIEINTSLSNQVILVLILYFLKKEKKKKLCWHAVNVVFLKLRPELYQSRHSSI